VKIAGRSNASSIISGAIYIVGFGTGDFFLNYYINPLLNKVHTPYQFSDILVQHYANFIQVYISLSTIVLNSGRKNSCNHIAILNIAKIMIKCILCDFNRGHIVVSIRLKTVTSQLKSWLRTFI